MKSRLQRGLEVGKDVERELQISSEVLFGKCRRDLAEPGALLGGGRDKPRVATRDLCHEKIAEIARELAAEVLQVMAVAFELIYETQHAAAVGLREDFGHLRERVE